MKSVTELLNITFKSSCNDFFFLMDITYTLDVNNLKKTSLCIWDKCLELSHSQWNYCMYFLLALTLSVENLQTTSKFKKYL